MADWVASPPQSRRGEGEESNLTGRLLLANSSPSPQSSPEQGRGSRWRSQDFAATARGELDRENRGSPRSHRRLDQEELVGQPLRLARLARGRRRACPTISR